MMFKYFLPLCFLMIFSCNNKEEHKNHGAKKIYTCPMHPEIIRDKPGSCPICGMDLVEKIEEGEKMNDSALTILLKPVNEYVVADISTIRPLAKKEALTLQADGYITYDQREVNTVSSRVAGRIEKLYVKAGFQPVRKGQRLMDLYSEELVTEQENYLFLLSNDANDKAIIEASENKLKLMGLTEGQLKALRDAKKVSQTVSVFSPYSGHLHDTPGMTSSGMNAPQQTSQPLSVSEGMYVQKGQTVFNIYSTERLWAVLNIYAHKQDLVKENTKIRLSIDGIQDSVEGKIDFIEPEFREGVRTISARVYLDNPQGKIKVGANVKSKLSVENGKGFFIPEKAVMSLGINSVVFVKKDGLFKAVPVTVGYRSDSLVQILSGIDKASELASNAQLLIDSESFVRMNPE